MIKKKEVTILATRRICDICYVMGEEIKAHSTCWLCRRDLCKTHIQLEHADEGDYPTVYCSHCAVVFKRYSDLQKPLQEEINRLEEEMQKEIDAFIKECREKKIEIQKDS